MTSNRAHPLAVESLQAEIRALRQKYAEQSLQLQQVTTELAANKQRLDAKNQLQTIIDTIPTLAWSASADGAVEFYSKRWRDYTGLSHEEASGWKWKVAIHPDDLDSLVEQWLKIMAARKPAELEGRMRGSDGTYRWFLFRVAPALDENGEVVKWFGTNTDIEMRKRTEDTLRANEERFRFTLDSIPGYVCTMTALGELEFISPSILEFMGTTFEETRNWGPTLHDEDRAMVISIWAHSVATGEPYDIQHRIRRADGVYRWFHVRGVAGTSADGQIYRWYILLVDIDDRKQAEMALQMRERELRMIIDSIPGMVSVAGSQGLHEYANKRALDFVGKELHEVTGVQWIDLIHPDERAYVSNEWLGCVAAKKPMDIVHRLRRHDGVYRLFRALVEPVFTAEGEVLKWYGILTDIETLRAAERVANAQLDALKFTLNALTKEPEFDKFMELVLHKVAGEMRAESVSVWKRSETNDMVLFATFEEGRVFYPSKGVPINKTISMTTRNHPVWRAAFASGTDCVLADLERDPPCVRLSGRDDAPWYPWNWNSPQAPELQPVIKRRLEAGVRGTLSVPLLLGGKPAGMLGIRVKREPIFEPTEIEMARALAHQAMLAIQLTQLSRESRQAAVTAERNRMARDIHDTLAQGLTGVIMQLEAAEDAQSKLVPAEAIAHVANARELARFSLQEARRSVRAMRPQALLNQDLCSALKELIGKMTADTKLVGEFTLHGPEQPLPRDIEETVLRVSQEVLTNAIRHARARHFTATFTYTAQGIRLEFRDDGIGFDLVSQHRGFGLLGIKERVEALNGELQVDRSSAGTQVVVTLPYAEISPALLP